MAERPKVFDRLRAASGSASTQRSLYRWLVHHHAEFAAIIGRIDRPSWDVVAAELQAEGLAKKDGSPLTAAYVRHAWWRAGNAIKDDRPKIAKTATPQRPAVAAPKPVRATLPRLASHTADEADDAGPAVPTFGVSKLRD